MTTGLIPYRQGWQLQHDYVTQIASGQRKSTIIWVEHEPVYTVGKRTHSWERPSGDLVDGVEVIDVDRGGKTTWHGPGQLTVYPLIKLAHLDVIEYVRALEGAVMQYLASLGLGAIRVPQRSGVWLPADEQRPERKICALGVRVTRGVTMHGIGLNVNPDLEAFSLERIIPCGISDAGVTSLAAELPGNWSISEVANQLRPYLEEHLSPLADPKSL